MAHYVSNKDLTAEIIACQTSNSRPNQVSDNLARMLFLIVSRYSLKGQFRGYSYRDEMVADALTHLCCGGNKQPIPPALRFNAGYAEQKAERDGTKALPPNPLAYLTTIIHHCFVRRLNIEKRNQVMRDDILIMSGVNPSYGKQVTDEMERSSDPILPPAPKAKVGRKPKRK